MEFAKVCSEFCQKHNGPFKICQSCMKLCLSGKISTNLVTLKASGPLCKYESTNTQDWPKHVS